MLKVRYPLILHPLDLNAKDDRIRIKFTTDGVLIQRTGQAEELIEMETWQVKQEALADSHRLSPNAHTAFLSAVELENGEFSFVACTLAHIGLRVKAKNGRWSWVKPVELKSFVARDEDDLLATLAAVLRSHGVKLLKQISGWDWSWKAPVQSFLTLQMLDGQEKAYSYRSRKTSSTFVEINILDVVDSE